MNNSSTRTLLYGSIALALFITLNAVTGFAGVAKKDPGPFVPGTIEAENYDTGGEGVAYHSASKTVAGKPYRPDAANIESISSGHAITLSTGEWFNYTVNVKSDGMYTLELRVAHNVGGDPLFIVACDGKDITGEMNAPYTGGPARWVTLSRPAIQLKAGEHVFTVKHIGGTDFYLDWMRFVPGAPPKPGPKPNAGKWSLVWSDEFNGTGRPDAAKWGYDIGGHGWGNKELQYYTDRVDNARLENGKLIIEAKKEDFKENHYTSARLVTRGKLDATYGRFEIRAKVPSALGSWPAIWLLGSNGKPWPANGEIDIMEHLGRNPGWIHGSTHSQKYYFKNGNQQTSITYIPDATSAFHEYAIEWYPDHIDFFVDNNKYLTVTNEKTGWEAWPFDDPEYLILNVAVGGWGGDVTEAHFPARMEVDYVRVYKQK